MWSERSASDIFSRSKVSKDRDRHLERLTVRNIPPTTYPLAFLCVNNGLFVDSSASPRSEVRTRCCLDQHVTTRVFVNEFSTHFVSCETVSGNAFWENEDGIKRYATYEARSGMSSRSDQRQELQTPGRFE